MSSILTLNVSAFLLSHKKYGCVRCGILASWLYVVGKCYDRKMSVGKAVRKRHQIGLLVWYVKLRRETFVWSKAPLELLGNHQLLPSATQITIGQLVVTRSFFCFIKFRHWSIFSPPPPPSPCCGGGGGGGGGPGARARPFISRSM